MQAAAITSGTALDLTNVSTALLWTVVKRGKYERFDEVLVAAIDRELAARRLAERRAN